MFEKTGKIVLSGEDYPIKCDILVLEKIQEKYGDLAGFEGKIRKFIPDRDKDGKMIQNKEGLYVGHYEYPNIPALLDFLYWSVQEGMEIEGKEEEINRNSLVRMVDMTLLELAEILHEEYLRAFERKNMKTMQNPKMKTAG